MLTQEAEDERGEDASGGGVSDIVVKFQFYKYCKEVNIFVIELFIHLVFVIVL